MFDYIIVGAGSAGCVLANRLSENPNINVCLLEAGPATNHVAVTTPAYMWVLMMMKSINWMYDTKPEQKLKGRRLYWPRAKMMGGCSSSNAMVYTRGNPKDYDHWQALGNQGWSYKDMLAYFKKAEGQKQLRNEFHGHQGPLNVEYLKNYKTINDAFYKAASNNGIRYNDDFNGAEQEGVGPYQVTQKNGRRWSTYEAYIKPVRKRKNLTILTKAMVRKVIMEGDRAVGIEYERKGKRKKIEASQEVILSGGAINSPQLLMLSGIGDKEQLKKHNIPVVCHLPGVGKNLQDHLDVTFVDRCKRWATHGIHVDQVITTFTDLFNYYVRGTGRLASNGTESGGFTKSSSKEDIPDLQYHFTAVELRNHGRDITALLGHAYSLHVCYLRPKSRGEVTLASANPKDKVDIQANYLDHPEDLEKLALGAKQALTLLRDSSFDQYRKGPKTPHSDVKTDEQIKDYIRERAESVYHPVGTCKMGQDDMAVVDSQLKVHGVKGLRVVDASIMPTIVGANTNAPTIAIGEKAAEMVLADYGFNERLMDRVSNS